MIRVKRLQGCQDEAWQGQRERVWLDVARPGAEEVAALKAHFEFNPLALEDALEADHWSRFERYPEHFYLIFRTLAEADKLSDRGDEVDFFWFPETEVLITFRNGPLAYLEAVWEEQSRFRERGTLDILYTLLQRGTDTFFTFVDTLEDYTEELEQRVLAGSLQEHSHVYTEVLHLRRTMILGRKLVSNAQENVAQFARHAGEVSEAASLLLRDVDDHLSRVYDGLDTTREIVGGLLDIYFTVQNSRGNETVRTLTTVSTIFLPLTFLAGVWGMNFDFIPELGWRYGYAFAWGLFIVLAGVLLWYFKRRGWW